uniref:Uncharacterized protein n=1 Tax=Arundo donax TaxID=35708 RepID=A0A0A9CLW1_ARUDO
MDPFLLKVYSVLPMYIRVKLHSFLLGIRPRSSDRMLVNSSKLPLPRHSLLSSSLRRYTYGRPMTRPTVIFPDCFASSAGIDPLSRLLFRSSQTKL